MSLWKLADHCGLGQWQVMAQEREGKLSTAAPTSSQHCTNQMLRQVVPFLKEHASGCKVLCTAASIGFKMVAICKIPIWPDTNLLFIVEIWNLRSHFHCISFWTNLKKNDNHSHFVFHKLFHSCKTQKVIHEFSLRIWLWNFGPPLWPKSETFLSNLRGLSICNHFGDPSSHFSRALKHSLCIHNGKVIHMSLLERQEAFHGGVKNCEIFF